MSPSTNTRSVPTDPITTLAVFPYTSSYLTQYDLENTVKHTHTDIKEILAKLLDESDKKDAKLDNKDEKIIELSFKFSTY